MITLEMKIARIAALMAVSNLGHFHNIKIDQLTSPETMSCDNAEYDICQIAGHLMECDDHETYFGDEALRWSDVVRSYDSLYGFAAAYPHHAEWIRKIASL